MADAAPRVLVADDNVQVLGLVESILRSAGYEVVPCEGGVSAVEAAEAGPFDLILLDGMMPDLDGFEACEIIRRFPHHARTPVAFLTGLTDDGTFEDATEVGADEVLAKPIRRSSLLLRVRSLLRLSRLQAEREAFRSSRTELTELLLGDLERPMTLIRSRALALQNDARLPPDLADLVRDLLGAEGDLQGIVRNLLDVQRSDEGTFQAVPGAVSPAELIAEVADSWRAPAASANVSISLAGDLPNAPLALDGDLLGRALDSCFEHAVRLARDEVVVGAEVTTGGVRISVRDDGDPVSPEEQLRASVSKDDSMAGATGRLPRSRGLGLVLCRMVAEAHHGSMEILAGEGGTEVILNLGLLKAEP